MSGTFMVAGKEIAVSEKLEKLEDKFEKIYPKVLLGYGLFVLGAVVGGMSEYKRGFSVGMLSGASLAYSHVIDTLKDLGARP